MTTTKCQEAWRRFRNFLADPALAARLLGLDETRLLSSQSTALTRSDKSILGALFESLAALSLKTYAQAAEATVYHMRTSDGAHEIDFLVHRADGSAVAIEVKLTAAPDDEDVRHLLWLRNRMGDALTDQMILCTAPRAYRSRDGVAVVPLAVLGP
jgi:hypothetical protein